MEELSKILHCGRNEDSKTSDVEVQTENQAPWSISGIRCLVYDMLKSDSFKNKTDKMCKYEDSDNTDFSLYHLVIFVCFGQFMVTK